MAPTSFCPYGGGTFNSPTGTISIPPQYANRVRCRFVIETGKPIYLRFDSFSIESSYDHVYVYDGDSEQSTSLGEFSGSVVPEIIKATSGSMFISFTSDSSGSSDGVSMTWSEAMPTGP